jgi:hypothetical protein
MTSTIKRFEHVLTMYERALPGYTSFQDAQWERHEQPTIKLSLDTAWSDAQRRDLESVRLRITWAFGRDQVVTLVRMIYVMATVWLTIWFLGRP